MAYCDGLFSRTTHHLSGSKVAETSKTSEQLPETVTLKISRGRILDPPVFVPGRRSRNWCAILSFDPLKSRSVLREFLQFKPGTSTYNAETLRAFSPLEFGSDWDSGTKHRDPVHKRFYGVVIDLTPSSLTLRRCSSANESIRLASRLRISHHEALLAELKSLRARISEIENALLGP